MAYVNEILSPWINLLVFVLFHPPEILDYFICEDGGKIISCQ
jgi:hypothetical protein